MKTMKSFIVGLVLSLGLFGMAYAGGRQGQGWQVAFMTGTVIDIPATLGVSIKLKAIILSSGSLATSGDNFVQCYSTAPSLANGAGVTLIPNSLFQATAAVTPAIMFLTSSTVSSTGGLTQGVNVNNVWKIGDGETDFLEIGGPIPGGVGSGGVPVLGGLHCRKNSAGGSNADQAAIYFSR